MATNGTRLPWEEVVQRKRRERDEAMEPFLTSPEEDLNERPIDKLAIHERSALESLHKENQITDEDEIQILLQQMQEGTLSAERVVRAFIKR